MSAALPLQPPAFRLSSLLPVSAATLRFAATTVAASLSALFLAFWLQLESPYWAATTVLIVAQPVPGQVVGKGFYRAVGTTTGAIMATLFIALFAQMPEIFIACMALWIAGCTAVSTLLRGFRSYGAVLAGYTAAIVAFSAAAAPDSVFDIAVARASAILLGILCGALASALFIPRRSRDELVARLRKAILEAASLIPDVAGGAERVADRRRLAGEIAATELLSEAATAETLELRRHMGSLHAALSELLTIVSTLRAIQDHLHRLGPEARAGIVAALQPGLRVVRERIHGLPAALAPETPGAAIHQLATGLGGSLLPDRSPDPDATVEELVVAERLRDALDALGRAIDGYGGLLGYGEARYRARLVFHRDPAQALRNALRAFLAVGGAGALWIATGWPAGGTFVTNVCVACSLFATQPRPSMAAFGFMRGAALAMVVAFICKFLLLPWTEGFLLLALVIGPVMFAGAVATTLPGWFGTATAFSVIFLTTLAPVNVMSYDPAGFLDSGLATLTAFLVGGTVFRVVLPTSPQTVARRILRRIRRDLAHIARSPGQADRSRLESLMYDRLARMFGLSSDPTLSADGVSALGVALEVIRMRALALPTPAEGVVSPVLAMLADPRISAQALERAAEDGRQTIDVMRRGAAGAERLALTNAEAGLSLIADAAREHPEFYAWGRAA